MTTAAESLRLRRWQALTLALLVSGYAGYYACRSNFNATQPLIIDEVAASRPSRDEVKNEFGVILSLGTLAYAVGKFVGGGISGRISGKGLFLVGMGGSILCTVGLVMGNSVPAFGAAWIGNRLVQSVGWLGLVMIASRWTSHARYGTVMGLLSVSYLWGDWLIKLAIARMIEAEMPWRSIFLVAAATLAVLFVLCVIWLRDSPRMLGLPEPEVNPENLFVTEGDDGPNARFADLIRPMLRSRKFLLVCALSMGFTLLRETFNSWTTEYYTRGVGLPPGEATARSAQFPLWAGLSVLLLGAASDRLGRHGRGLILFLGLVLTGMALMALGLVDFHGSKGWPVVLVTTIGFVLIGPYSYLAGAMAMDFGGKKGSAMASGLIDSVGYLGAALSGFGVAKLSTRYSWPVAFLVLSGIAWLTAVAAGWFWLDQRRPSALPGEAP